MVTLVYDGLVELKVSTRRSCEFLDVAELANEELVIGVDGK